MGGILIVDPLKRQHLDDVEDFIPKEVRSKFCVCENHYPYSQRDGILYCYNCNKILFYLRRNHENPAPDNALTFTVLYSERYPHVKTKSDHSITFWIAEVRDCDMCEEIFIVSELPYDNEFCPDCEAVQ